MKEIEIKRLVELLIRSVEETQLCEGIIYGVGLKEESELWILIEEYQKENSLKSLFNDKTN